MRCDALITLDLILSPSKDGAKTSIFSILLAPASPFVRRRWSRRAKAQRNRHPGGMAGAFPSLHGAFGLFRRCYGAIVKRRFRTASPYRSDCAGHLRWELHDGRRWQDAGRAENCVTAPEAGGNPGFLTRGYGGSERGPHVIDSAADNADRVGDEPLLLARAGTTVVSRDRPAGAKLLETLGVDSILMDDGFQNPSLEKDFSLVVVDAGAGSAPGVFSRSVLSALRSVFNSSKPTPS